MNSTETKVIARIAAEIETADNFAAAVRTACWKAIQEARTNGWPERTQQGIVATFIAVGADMAAAHAAA